MPMYVVRKWIRATSMKDALRKEKDTVPSECYLSDSGVAEMEGKNEGNKEVKGLSK